MRKDYMIVSDTEVDETAFVADYWTKVWEKQGGPKSQVDQIPNKAEYRIMKPYLDRLQKPARILDGGCGLGDWTARLTQEGFSVVGLDLSVKTVAQLEDIFPDCDFQVGDIRETGAADNSFDAYFSWGVFEHFENGPQDCIAEALRVLKPGGYLFMSTPLDNLRHALRGTFAGKRAFEGESRFYQYRFTRAELSTELSKGGFDVLKLHPIHKRQGVLRSLHHEFKMPYEWFLTKGMSAALAPFVPGVFIAHMVLAVARKPE
ncbi:MAG: methyltransferase domain-containing protein [Alphaproteobacteria bacterium]|nr:methyltransferase domain-containing protein [Alphaproteobacteria bacterium]